jgi:flavin reductase (DIM6/NTAB) family NADH-FMN oxidoreductase RutF
VSGTNRVEAFDTIMAAADPPLVVLTTAAENERAGCLVGFHAQSSMTPRHYCVWLSKANHTYLAGLRASHFALHFLAENDLGLAQRFGTLCGDVIDKFDGLDLDIDRNGVPLLTACPNRLLLERVAMLDVGGDHVCLTTEVTSSQTGGPFVALRVSAASDLDPGHDSGERTVHP